MDVDVLSVKKQAEMMKKGQCFNCRKMGHLSRDCNEKKKKLTTSFSLPTYTPPKKMMPKEMYTHICSFTTQMNEDEKEQLYQEAEKEGF